MSAADGSEGLSSSSLLLFSDEELREMSGLKKGSDFVEVMCGCTSRRYGDAVGRLRVFSSGHLQISCECTPGCDQVTAGAMPPPMIRTNHTITTSMSRPCRNQIASRSRPDHAPGRLHIDLCYEILYLCCRLIRSIAAVRPSGEDPVGLKRRLEKNFEELDGFYNQVIEEHLSN